MKNLAYPLIASSIFFTLSGCKFVSDSASSISLPDTVAMAFEDATSEECTFGGKVMKLFKDKNLNGIYDDNEIVISSTPICNGSNGTNGTNGTNGISAGIEVKTASPGSCPAGGTVINTFQDLNSNGLLDMDETISSTSTVCNGADGKNTMITSALASSSQCAAGGVIYTTLTGEQAPQSNIVCNGVNGINGSNGSNAVFMIGSVGTPVDGKTYTSCHHDYVYLPDGVNSNQGWLIFRHQKNGNDDQGIGSTGFNLWNVDISDFILSSEVGGVNYCSLHWDPGTKNLTFTVMSNNDGHAGETGTIQF